MVKLRILFKLLLIVIPLSLSALDLFDQAANLYINGKLDEAKLLVETALNANPDDSKLQQLLQKINEELEQEKQNQQQQGQNQEQQNQQEQQQQQAQQKEEEQQQAEKEKEEQQQAAQQEQTKEEKINKDEAERLLNALKSDEQEAQKRKAPVRGNRRPAGKDW